DVSPRIVAVFTFTHLPIRLFANLFEAGEFWAFVGATAAEVDRWPAWKKVLFPQKSLPGLLVKRQPSQKRQASKGKLRTPAACRRACALEARLQTVARIVAIPSRPSGRFAIRVHSWRTTERGG